MFSRLRLEVCEQKFLQTMMSLFCMLEVAGKLKIGIRGRFRVGLMQGRQMDMRSLAVIMLELCQSGAGRGLGYKGCR
jgi:hypothetical protein